METKEALEKIRKSTEVFGGYAALVRLYRASSDDFVRAGTSFAETLDTAQAYQDNPGFGGPQLFSAVIHPSKVLDITGGDLFSEVGEIVGREIDPAEYQDHEARLFSDDAILAELSEAGYDWVRFTDDFPADDAVTWIPLNEDAADKAFDANQPFVI